MTAHDTDERDGDRRALNARLVELEQENARLRRAAVASPVMGAWDWDLVTDHLVTNEHCARLYGVDPKRASSDGLPSDAYLRRIHVADQARAAAEIDEGLRSGKYVSEYRLPTDAGGARWVLSRGALQFDAEGRPTRMLGVAIDITERREAEEARRRHAERQALLVVIARTILEWTGSRADLARDIFAKLAGHCAIDLSLNYQISETDGALYLVAAPGLDPGAEARVRTLPAASSYCGSVAASRCLMVADAAAIRADDRAGHLRAIGVHAYVCHPLVGADGRILGTLSFARNRDQPFEADEIEFFETVGHLIALAWQRNAAEHRIRESEARMKLAAEVGHIGVFHWDLLCDRLDWDEHVKSIWAIPADEPVTRAAFLAGVHPEDRPYVTAILEQALDPDGPGDVQVEYRVVGRLDGIVRYVSARGRVRFTSGRAVTMVGIVSDVTAQKRAAEILERDKAELERLVEARTVALLRSVEEQRQAEAALRHNEKLAALGQLTGGVAHDFNNLLQVVSSGVSLLSRPTLDEKRRTQVLDGMRQALNNSLGLTQRLLAFARQQTLRPVTFDPAERIRMLRDMLMQTLDAGIRTELDLAPDVAPLYADVGQFDVALLNLILNARDAMPEGGTLTIAARNDDAPLAGRGAVAITIADTGIGMEPAVRDKVFEPFFTTKPLGKGTGLGLPQVLGFVQQTGGDVRIESTPGTGSAVTMRLPRADTAITETADADLRAPRRGSGKGPLVLVVDDNVQAAEFAAQLMQDLGYRTRIATSGQDALAVLGGNDRVDVVFSDVVMPGDLGGLELARVVEQQHPHVAIVLTTGYSDRLRAGLAGRDRHILPKPYQLTDVAVALSKALAGGVAAE
jgi:PAS domain S-box-containing protein